MAFLDDVNVLFGRGMNAADKKAQSMRLRADLNRVVTQKERALAELGRVVYEKEGLNSIYAQQVRAIADLDAQEAQLQQRLAELQGPGEGTPLSVLCPACASPVSLSAPQCPVCGDNLASLKSHYRKCPSCDRYYTADFAFCEYCGKKTIELVVARVAPVQDSDAKGSEDVCPHCKAPLKPGSVFCGACGKKI